MIGTHNSATGEKSKWTSLWVIPFARCQSKTLVEQYNAGCRSFDLRIRWNKKGKYVFAHGLWESSVSVEEALAKLNEVAKDDKIYVSVMYEGSCNNISLFQEEMETLMRKFDSFILTHINIKYGSDWILFYNHKPAEIAKYKILDGRSWHTYIPIPWLWSKIYKGRELDYINIYVVDFL